MKTKLLSTFLLLFSIISVNAQTDETKILKGKVLALKSRFNIDLIAYNANVAKLKDVKNFTNATIDLNATRDSTLAQQKRLTDYCEKKTNLMELFDTSKDSINDWFGKDTCKDFSEKVSARSSTTSPATDDEHVTLLIGYNFDFEKTNASNGYMGHLNIHFLLNKKYSINAGLMKINYSGNSDRVEYKTDNVNLHPLGTAGGMPDTKYVSQYNKYTLSVESSSYGAYFQLMRRIRKDYLYAHMHAELLVSQAEFAAKVTTIQSDTLNLPTSQTEIDTLGLRKTLGYDLSDKTTFYAGYFGLGLTGDFTIINKDNYLLKYFIQGTTGFTNNQLNDDPKHFKANDHEFIDKNLNYNVNPLFNKKCFFIVSTYITAKYEGIRLYIGAEIRGVYSLAPIHIFYAGVNLDLFKIASVFKT